MEIIKDATLGDILKRTIQRWPDRPAIQYKDDIWTYRQVDAETDKIAAGFLAAGIKKGTHVGIWANDRPNTLLCLYALIKIGAVAVMLGTSLSENEIKSHLEESDTEYLLFDEGYKGIDFLGICRRLSLPRLSRLIFIGLMKQQDFDTLKDLCAEGKGISAEQLYNAKCSVWPEDPDVILFTSGTTSSPKGVVTTHYSRVNNIMAQAEAINTTHKDKFLIAIPMFHCLSLSGSILAAMTSGACVCFPEDRRTQTILRTVESCRCTVFNAVPTLFSALLAREDLNSYNLSSLRTGLIGGSMYPPSLFIEVCLRMGIDLLPSLGQTEATAGFTVGSYSDSMETKSSTVGHFMEHTDGCIMDQSGNPVETGKPGEICIRGYNVMKGYYKHPELTEKVIDKNGWLHTGDLGYLDEKNNIHMIGRIKELIIRDGENIAPGEIENVILEKPGVKEVKVVGIPDDHYIEEICSCIVCEEDIKITEKEIRDHVKGRLAYYKVPKYILFMDEIPKATNGKYDIMKCKEKATQMLGIKRDTSHPAR